MTTIATPDVLILMELDFDVKEPEVCMISRLNEARIPKPCGRLATIAAEAFCEDGHGGATFICSGCLVDVLQLRVGCGIEGCNKPVVIKRSKSI